MFENRSVKNFLNFVKSCLVFIGPFKVILLSKDVIERS